MHHCSSCGSTLDDDGICPSCGALSRGFFRGLDLGAPQIAKAVQRGLDFYLLLGVPPAADIRVAARRYRQLRALFPDNPSRLNAAATRRLELLEVAGRALTDPYLRRIYDELRASDYAAVTNAVLRCAACGAPLPPDAAACVFCDTPRPVEAQPPAAPPTGLPPATEPVDYYALIGLTATHLYRTADAPLPRNTMSRYGMPAAIPMMKRDPPTAMDVDEAALTRERAILMTNEVDPRDREQHLHELEVARLILRDERRRERYDQLLRDFQRGQLDGGRLDSLEQLQHEVQAEIAAARGEPISAAEGQALLQQGVGYLDAAMPREAVAALSKAVQALPQEQAAHAAYVRALLAAEEPLDMGGHTLRQILDSLAALDTLGAPLPNGAAVAALCRGMLARDAGNVAAATPELQRAVQIDKHMATAWRGLAALALARGDYDDAFVACRRALACEPRNERALLMLTGICLRDQRGREAREAAAQLAAVRGGSWTAEAVLRELT